MFPLPNQKLAAVEQLVEHSDGLVMKPQQVQETKRACCNCAGTADVEPSEKNLRICISQAAASSKMHEQGNMQQPPFQQID